MTTQQQQQETIKNVTKIKNPNRVTAGKKVYEERMLKLKEQILSSNESTKHSSNSSNTINVTDNETNSDTTNGSSKYYYVGGGVVLLTAAAIVLIYFKMNSKEKQPKETQKAAVFDPF